MRVCKWNSLSLSHTQEESKEEEDEDWKEEGKKCGMKKVQKERRKKTWDRVKPVAVWVKAEKLLILSIIYSG